MRRSIQLILLSFVTLAASVHAGGGDDRVIEGRLLGTFPAAPPQDLFRVGVDAEILDQATGDVYALFVPSGLPDDVTTLDEVLLEWTTDIPGPNDLDVYFYDGDGLMSDTSCATTGTRELCKVPEGAEKMVVVPISGVDRFFRLDFHRCPPRCLLN